MKIITTQGVTDLEKDMVTILFNDDDELSSFIQRLVTTPVRTSGVRIISLMPEGMELSPIQTKLFEVLCGLDGIGSKSAEQNNTIANESIERINDILKQ